ncbi:hypothetical protein [Micromonospora carbonacea]|uniref:Uncharacterized protein n=1 Tax=Micromonospora carbonacea TaxID=47853 RepID=A0A7H8XGM9_9ACTN|nr:hypothetical protein [Micromonospora carbonacea]MBB5828142.1 hypothetical protein [Micromonospora carbonacea]QLD24213.1 hypothetical protein HXZ27_08280 [Micromonospora carbonacea]
MTDDFVPRPNLVPPRPGRTEEPRPLVPSYRDEDEGRTTGGPLNLNLRDELTARLEAAVAETLRHRAARRQQREGHAAARAAGLASRHRDRLARRKATMPDTNQQTLAVDVAELRDSELSTLAGVLGKVATWRTLSEPVVVTLAALAQQAGRIRADRDRPARPSGQR